MGYTTDFEGKFELNKKLNKKLHTFLTKFSETRRMARNVDPKYGVEGEFYVDGIGYAGQDDDDTIIDNNRPPKTQPGLWCQWIPSECGKYIEWDGGEKFYDYIQWLQYIVDNFLKPNGYKLNGEVKWFGEDREDTGIIIVKNNKISVKYAVLTYKVG